MPANIKNLEQAIGTIIFFIKKRPDLFGLSLTAARLIEIQTALQEKGTPLRFFEQAKNELNCCLITISDRGYRTNITEATFAAFPSNIENLYRSEIDTILTSALFYVWFELRSKL